VQPSLDLVSSLSAVQVSAPGVATSPTPVASGNFHGQSEGMGVGVGDMLTPLQRVEPVYPYRAQQAGIEGSVTVRFTINSEGRVENVEVIEAKPKRQFERAAIQAVSKWRYQPRPGATDKLEQVINLKFKLES
jgi:protein TonB